MQPVSCVTARTQHQVWQMKTSQSLVHNTSNVAFNGTTRTFHIHKPTGFTDIWSKHRQTTKKAATNPLLHRPNLNVAAATQDKT